MSTLVTLRVANLSSFYNAIESLLRLRVWETSSSELKIGIKSSCVQKNVYTFFQIWFQTERVSQLLGQIWDADLFISQKQLGFVQRADLLSFIISSPWDSKTMAEMHHESFADPNYSNLTTFRCACPSGII